MANLTPVDAFDDVYQLERTDPVDAGVNGAGVSNRQAQQLANRTQHLKTQQDAHAATLEALGTAANQPTSAFASAAQGAKADSAVQQSTLGQPFGVAALDANAKLLTSQLPPLAISDVTEVASEAAQLALVAEVGDFAVRTDQAGQMYIRNNGTAGDMTDWTAVNVVQPISSDAPSDGAQYLRRNGAWAPLDMTAPQIEVTTSRDLATADNNAILVCTNAAPIVLSLTAGLPVGFGCLVLCAGERVHIVDIDAPLTQDGKNTLTTPGHAASVVALTTSSKSSWLAGSLDDTLDVLRLQDNTGLQLQDASPLEIAD
jgi:hypothetical protein